MSATSKRLLASLSVTFLFVFLISPFGATFLGVVSADTYLVAMTVMGLTVGLWWLTRIRKRWLWHRTALDLVFVLWGIAIVASILANPETVRRSMIGLWYMMLYVGIWYLLHDILSNRGLTRKLLVDSLLNAGVFIILFSVIQFGVQGKLTPMVSIIGNPNALGAVLLLMIPFVVSRIITAQSRVARLAWALYSIVMIVNLLLTLSRGAWLGMFTAVAMLGLLVLHHHKMLSREAFARWWGKRTQGQRFLLSSSGLAVGVVVLIVGGLFINSFTIQARRPELRTRLWNSALMQFAEKPITGQGLYTFGHDYGLSISIPSAQSHAHAHSVPFNIMAEMGLIGLVAFIFTLAVVVRLVIRRWSIVEKEDRVLWIAAISSLVGVGVHHLFDLPAMMPIVALTGLLVLVLVCAPYQPQPLTASWRKYGHTIGMVALWSGLLVTGLWSGSIYKQYLDAMRIGFSPVVERTQAEQLEDYRETVRLLDDVITQDPRLPIYRQQQALVWGLIAAHGDENAIQKGIEAYQSFLELEPNHTISRANMAALQWQSGDVDAAIQTMEQVVERAPNYSFFNNTLRFYRGEMMREDEVQLPDYIYSSDYASFEFLREPLPITFLPQLGWQSPNNN